VLVAAAGRGAVVVVGEIPREPVGFQPRADLLAALAVPARVSVVRVVTGLRGVGKAHRAAAYARARLADRWRLVAWISARGAGPAAAPRRATEFALSGHEGVTRLEYTGELGTDFGAAGQWWGDRVGAAWEAAVRASFASIRAEAQRSAAPRSSHSAGRHADAPVPCHHEPGP
jgi:hypothetical protein